MLLVCALLVLPLAACDGDQGEAAPTGDPLIDNVALARTELAQVEKEWLLYRAGAIYDVTQEEHSLRRHSYLFTTADSSYYVVHVDASGEMSSGPVAGRVMHTPPGYDFAGNELSAQDAMDRAWTLYGTAVVHRCGPLVAVEITGGAGNERTPDGHQWWSVAYDTGRANNTIFIDAVTGDLMEWDDISCE